MNIETFAGGPPTSGESFSKLIHHIREAQEQAAVLAHLNRDDNPLLSKGWLLVENQLKRFVHTCTLMATRRMQ